MDHSSIFQANNNDDSNSNSNSDSDSNPYTDFQWEQKIEAKLFSDTFKTMIDVPRRDGTEVSVQLFEYIYHPLIFNNPRYRNLPNNTKVSSKVLENGGPFFDDTFNADDSKYIKTPNQLVPELLDWLRTLYFYNDLKFTDAKMMNFVNAVLFMIKHDKKVFVAFRSRFQRPLLRIFYC